MEVYLITTLIGLSSLFFIRIYLCLPCFNKYRTKKVKTGNKPLKTVVIFGSGGHTTEMLQLLHSFGGIHYHPICFVLSDTDKTSKEKILSSELNGMDMNQISWYRIQRSREVKQSWISTIFTTLLALLQSIQFVFSFRPDLIICNGPGTCLPICYSAFLFKILGINTPIIIFVESFCRVQNLSLTGKLLYPIADSFIVQWPDLRIKYPRSTYLGRIC